MKHSQLEFAAVRRQRILDFLAAHPGAKMPAVNDTLRALGDDGNAFNTIRTMIEWGEVRFEGTARTRRYWALVSVTRSAHESCRIRLANAEAANAARHQQKVVSDLRKSLGGKVHHPGDRPIPNQGGQGAVRHPVCVSYSQSY